MRSALIVFLFALASCGPTTGDACRNHTCQGCCTSDGRCESGTSQLACGQRSDQCTQCTLGTSCTFGICTANPVSGGGGGTSTGGGSGGGGGGTGGGVSGGGTGGGLTTGGGTGGGGGACVPESDTQFCARLRYDCDLISAFDNCGTNRSANCGNCTGPQTCGGGGTLHVCGGATCVSESDAAFCARLGAACGSKTGTDNCNVSRTVNDCGTCFVNECQNSNTCINNFCEGSAKQNGTRCGVMSSITDRNFCHSGVCTMSYSYCDYVSSGNQWIYQKNGTGGAGNGPCTCSSSTMLHYEYNIPNLPIADHNDVCSLCAMVGTRAVCF